MIYPINQTAECAQPVNAAPLPKAMTATTWQQADSSVYFYPKNDDNAQALANTPVTRAQAEQAFADITEKLGINETLNQTGSHPLTLDDWSKLSVSTLVLAILSTACQSAAKYQKLIAEGMEMATEASKILNDIQVKDYRAEVDNAIKEQEKAKKGGIIQNVVHWAVACAEIVIGAFKVLGGAVTGSFNECAAGILEMSAGCTGLVGAAIEAAALAKKDPKKYDALMEKARAAFHVQLGLELTSACIDFCSVIARYKASQKMASHADNALSRVEVSFRAVGPQVELDMCTLEKQICLDVARNSSDNIARIAVAESRTVAQNYVQSQVSKRMLGELSEACVEEIVKKSIDDLAHMSGDATEASVKKVLRNNIHASVKQETGRLGLATTQAPAYFGELATGISSNITNMQVANIQAQIEKIHASSQLLGMLEAAANDIIADLKTAMEKEAQLYADTVETSNKAIASLARGQQSIIAAFTQFKA